MGEARADAILERDERELRKVADTLGEALADKLRHDQ